MKRPCIRPGVALGSALAALLASGCFGGGTPLEVRRVRPVIPETETEEPARGVLLPLYVSPVRASSSLGEPVGWTRADGRTGVYEDLRWNDAPALAFERALARALFEHGGFRRTLRGDAPELDVELVAFQERIDVRAAEIVFTWRLWRGTTAEERTERVRVPITSTDDAGLARAMGDALQQAVHGLRDAVRERLAANAGS